MTDKPTTDPTLPKGYARKRCKNCNRVRPCRFQQDPWLAEVRHINERKWLCDECVTDMVMES